MAVPSLQRLIGGLSGLLGQGPIKIGVVFSVVLALALTLLNAAVPGLLGLEQWTSDLRTAILSPSPPRQHPGLAVIAVTEDTLARYPYREPVDRGLLAGLIRTADAAGASVIALDFRIDQPTEPAKDAELLDAIRKAKAPVVLGAADERVPLSESQESYQRHFIAQSERPAGYLNLSIDGDDVVRSSAGPGFGSLWDRPFAGLVAEASGKPARGPGRIAWLKPPLNGNDTFAVYPAHLIYPASAAAGAGLQIDAYLRGRVVLIGALLPGVDEHQTPLTMIDGGLMPGVLLQAQMIAERLDGRRVYDVTGLPLFLVLTAVAFSSFVLGWLYRLKRFNAAVTVLAALCLLLVDILAFQLLKLTFPFGTALIATLASVTSGHVLELVSRRLTRESHADAATHVLADGSGRRRLPVLGFRARH